MHMIFQWRKQRREKHILDILKDSQEVLSVVSYKRHNVAGGLAEEDN